MLKRSTRDTKNMVVNIWILKVLMMTICGNIIISMAILRASLNHLVQVFTDQEVHCMMKPLVQVHQRPLYQQLNLRIRSKSLSNSMGIIKNTGHNKMLNTRRR